MVSFSNTHGAVYSDQVVKPSILKNGAAKEKDLKTVWGKAGDKVELEDIEILSRVEPNAMEGI